jgi:hypothetical protein
MQLLNEALYNSYEHLASKTQVTFKMWTKESNPNFRASYASANPTQKHPVWAEHRISEC